MRGPQILPLIKSVTTNTACLLPGGLFSGCSSTRESTTYQSPSNTPPVPVIDNRLPYERCSEAVRQLHPSFPPNCTLFEEGEVEVVSDIQVEADGYADIWKARSTLDGYSVIQKSHRCHETEDVGPVFKVRLDVFSRTAWPTSYPRDITERFQCAASFPTRTLLRSSGSTPHQTTPSRSSSTLLAISGLENILTRTPRLTS